MYIPHPALPLVLVTGLLGLIQAQSFDEGAGLDMHIDFLGSLRPRAENLMSFTGNIGGSCPAITQSTNTDRPFSVNGDTFVSFEDAWQRSCDIQKNLCGDFANSAAGRSAGVQVQQCEDQNASCDAAAASASPRTFGTGTTGGSGSGSGSGTTAAAVVASPVATYVSSDDTFDYYCEP